MNKMSSVLVSQCVQYVHLCIQHDIVFSSSYFVVSHYVGWTELPRAMRVCLQHGIANLCTHCIDSTSVVRLKTELSSLSLRNDHLFNPTAKCTYTAFIHKISTDQFTWHRFNGTYLLWQRWPDIYSNCNIFTLIQAKIPTFCCVRFFKWVSTATVRISRWQFDVNYGVYVSKRLKLDWYMKKGYIF